MVDEMSKVGFGRISQREVLEDFQRYKIERTKPHSGGREEGFFYIHRSGYMVRVWTSFILAKDDYRRLDWGWVIIVDRRNKIVYRAQITRRTRNFAYNLLMRARMAFERVHNRPICEGCGSWLDFVQQKNGGCFWSCPNIGSHGSHKACPKLDPDITFSPEVRKYAKEKRADRARDRKDSRRKTPRGNGMGRRKSSYKRTRAPFQ